MFDKDDSRYDALIVGELPLDDSRLKGYNGAVTHPHLPLERTYCAICGRPKGWVNVETAEHIRAFSVIVICDSCDEDLRNKLGPVPLQEAAIEEMK